MNHHFVDVESLILRGPNRNQTWEMFEVSPRESKYHWKALQEYSNSVLVNVQLKRRLEWEVEGVEFPLRGFEEGKLNGNLNAG